MRSKSKRPVSAPESPQGAHEAAGGDTVILVRRGALRRFDALKRKTEDLPVVVSWDRRLQERRNTPSEPVGKRRGTDRRQPVPFTWELADFVVVPSASAATEPPARPKRLPAPSRASGSSSATSRAKTARTAKRPKR